MLEALIIYCCDVLIHNLPPFVICKGTQHKVRFNSHRCTFQARLKSEMKDLANQLIIELQICIVQLRKPISLPEFSCSNDET